MKPYAIFLVFALSAFSPLEAQKIDVYSRPERTERSRNYDVLHYRIELRFDEDARSYWGDTTITLAALENGFSTCVLDAETFVVDKVVDTSSHELEFEQGEGRLVVQLAEPIGYQEETSFTVTYSAVNVDVEADKYGLSASYDLGLDFEEETKCCPRIIKTASWPEGARHWFPSYDHPNDRATEELLATVRDDYKVLSNGRLVSVTDGTEPGTKTWHWSQEQTHPTYLFVLVAGPYVVIKDSLGDLPINYWVYEGDKNDAMRSFWKTPQIIAFFNEEFGYAYPWAKYDQITVHGHSGGMESTTATVLGRGTLHDERAEQDFPSHSLVAHEAAHMWWGDLVTYRAWKETWLSESFATYSEYLFTKHDLGEDEGAVNLLDKKDDYLREAHNEYMRPIVFDHWRYPNNNFDAHTYPKGAVVLNMLRWIMGDDNFRHALSHFLHKYAFQPVDTHDFIKAVKEATGQNIEWFIEQWIFHPGHPVFDVAYDWDESEKKIILTIRQTQDTLGNVPIYETPVTIGIHTPRGKTSKRVWLQKQEEVFELDADQKPLLLRFDEGNYLLKEWTFEKSTGELLYQLEKDDVIGRMWAASELVKHGNDPGTIKALVAAAKGDPFWAVRRSAVEALGKVDGRGQIAFLQDKAEDASSKVRVAALGTLGGTGDPGLVDFFMKRFEVDDSYLAQAEALRSIGKTADSSARAFLEEARKLASPRNVIERAATQALEQIGR